MKRLTLYIIFCSLLLRTVVEPRPVRHQRSKRNTNSQEMEFIHNANLVYSETWRCNAPKPRLVYLNEATAGAPTVTSAMHLYLNATVLHRCEPAFGCCTPPKNCGPSSTETVTVTFKTRDVVNDHPPVYHRVSFLNHTQCACRN